MSGGHVGTRRREDTLLAVNDVREGLSSARTWGILASRDVRSRYRRSRLGPLWSTLQPALFIAALCTFHAVLLHEPLGTRLSTIATGYIVWVYILGLVTAALTAFAGHDSLLRNACLPRSFFVLRGVAAETLVLGRVAILVPVVLLVCRVPVSATLLLVVPGLLALAVNGVLLGLWLGPLVLRYPDLRPWTGSLMQVMFFLTPVMWRPPASGWVRHLFTANPLGQFVELVRAPLLGEVPALSTVGLVIVATVVNAVIAGLVFRQVRARIGYWT